MTVGERGHALLERVTIGMPSEASPLTHVAQLPDRPERQTDWPDWVPPALVDALGDSGVSRPWSHQRAAADAAWAGDHVVVATGTASGKSLAYQLPVLSGLLHDPKATALYLAPTKALCSDQLRAVRALGFDEIGAARYDGDTSQVERDWARSHARWLFSNPDMVHRGILPQHERWTRLFRRLRYVVVDECHAYRGVFGSHVSLLLRRLRRVARHYGADPVFVLASATVAEPEVFASRLTGASCVAVTDDGSPRGGRTVALWEPPLLPEITGENGAPIRRSAGAETAGLLADLVLQGARTLAFVRSRRGAETTALQARRLVAEVDPTAADRIAAYRAGYLAEDRRALEQALSAGELLGVATTNALELGIDISGLDAVVIAGYPGTLASFWQQAGRAGRRGDGALVVFIARDDPMDTYLVHHPDALLSSPVEAAVLDPGNPYVAGPQLACAAAELPLTEASLTELAGADGPAIAEGLVADGLLRRRKTGWFWTQQRRPHHDVDIRGAGGEQIVVVEGDTARLLGTVDPVAACHTVHPGAVYLHQGESFVVDELHLADGIALVHAEAPDWTTSARETVDISVVRELFRRTYAGGVTVCLGEVDVTSQVVGYLRRLPSGQVLDQVALDLPEHRLHTRAVWYSMHDELLHGRAPGGAGLDPARTPGALHAAEHAAIGLLPLFATCDRWDIGGVSTAFHEQTGEATVFVHDGHAGGAGFADRGFAALVPWLSATREAISACECPAGCPSCVQSPKCGNGNEPLDKAGSVLVLDAVLSVIGSADDAR
ncbi:MULTISPECIES: DEAD/DEAH box helicase [Actinoalloteichus]|uniref:Helicase/secretion neighborhood putative DEAH-box helicase n=1 Tax=Actinoalloteichus fjordicus TaxID=1612552 RepID=A0AAC9L8L1_9PSEU|nr:MULTISPECIES: DEAD/DEAH box helicase [Actinoalloteichus]APU12375.1 helicase/secretion neighborhood putative DEAH-box helicase [Actinoalloteichus fjordicus]APU18327.1 helicase/secretion neighborhood putative DEAH-box helicase [Actinoalloteichus sp. GBA129-24]